MTISDLQGFIFDIDGVIFRGDELIDSAKETLQILKRKSIKYIFVSNHTIYTKQEYLDKLRKFGLEVEDQQLLTANDAVIFFITHHVAPHSKVFVIGTEGMKQAMREGGLELVEKDPDVVIVGVHPTVTHEELRNAAIMVHSGAKLVVAGPDRRAVTDKGFDLGSGALGTAIAHAANVVPIFAAKPFSPIVEEALERLQLPKELVAIVGDTPETDIMTKYEVGLGMAILVLSGNTKKEQIDTIPEDKKPDMILASIKEIPAYL